MKLETAIQIPMSVWPDPQGNPLLLLSERLTLVYLGCWESSAKPANYACRLAFEHGWAARAMKVEFLPYDLVMTGTSPLFEVVDSAYLREVDKWRQTAYPEWKTWDASVYRHFLVSGHDSYVEVIAKDFREDRIPIEEAREIMPRYYREFVAELPDEWI
jgi:hypothetical protein